MIDMVRSQEMTQKQDEIMGLYINQKLTVTQIACRLGIKKSSVCRHLKYIKQKLGIGNTQKNNYLQRLTKGESGGYNPPQRFKNLFIRLHALHFVIVPYHTSDFYKELIKNRQNVIPFFHGWRVELNRENIEIISLEDTFFVGKDRFEAFTAAFRDFNKLLLRLENRLKIGIIKNDYMNVRLVKQHIAVVRDGVAERIDDDKYITLFNKDGEAWFNWDLSKDEPEWETIHPRDAKLDHDQCQKYIGDWKDNNPPNNTELAKMMLNMMNNQTEVIKVIAAPHIQNQENLEAIKQTAIKFKTDYIG